LPTIDNHVAALEVAKPMCTTRRYVYTQCEHRQSISMKVFSLIFSTRWQDLRVVPTLNSSTGLVTSSNTD